MNKIIFFQLFVLLIIPSSYQYWGVDCNPITAFQNFIREEFSKIRNENIRISTRLKRLEASTCVLTTDPQVSATAVHGAVYSSASCDKAKNESKRIDAIESSLAQIMTLLQVKMQTKTNAANEPAHAQRIDRIESDLALVSKNIDRINSNNENMISKLNSTMKKTFRDEKRSRLKSELYINETIKTVNDDCVKRTEATERLISEFTKEVTTERKTLKDEINKTVIHIFRVISDHKNDIDSTFDNLQKETNETKQRLSHLDEIVINYNTAPEQCGIKSDLVIMIDASTSVTQANYDKQLQFTKDVLKNLDIDSGAVRVGILIYSTKVQIQFHLNRYSTKTEVFAAIDKIPYIYGSTNTADAISTMHKTMFTQRNGDRPDVPNTCILITDGVSNINSRKTIPNAEAAHAENIHIYAVGIGLKTSRELYGIASHTENSFNVQSFGELKGLAKKIFPALCTEKGVVPTKQPGCTLTEVDLVIILDASRSVTAPNFQKMRDFCKDLVDYADVDSGNARIGVLIYSTDVKIQFHLNEYKTATTVKAAIDNIPYISTRNTNTADAIRTMRSKMFTRSNGDRLRVPNVGIVLTDGFSNINPRTTSTEADIARMESIELYAIGIGLTHTGELDAIANTPTYRFSFHVQTFEELASLAKTIFGAGCATIAPDL